MMKRLFDIVLSGLGILLLSPLLLTIAALIKVCSRGPIFFRHERVGKGFRPFDILKFRTMVQNAPTLGGPITIGSDPRITPLGKWLRRLKIDELPQLFNVLIGDMSLVGPRPEVRRYVEMFADDYAEILSVRPGITDLASIRYRDEAEILGQAADPAREYARVVLPEKIRLAHDYLRQQSFWFDVTIILRTVACLFRDRIARSQPANANPEKHA
jgi:lipopolysaccharide/colanic/teichoic acid biosynthesis glycosyltransferase